MFLVVPDNTHYNDTAALAIRQLASKDTVPSTPIQYGLIDSSKQTDFIKSFSGIPDTTCDPYHPVRIHLVSCY